MRDFKRQYFVFYKYDVPQPGKSGRLVKWHPASGPHVWAATDKEAIQQAFDKRPRGTRLIKVEYSPNANSNRGPRVRVF